MNKEDLLKLKEKISKLTDEEKKLRRLYLRGLSTGEIEGPMTDYASIDKPWLKCYEKDVLVKNISHKSVYEELVENNRNNKNNVAISYFGKKYTYKQLIELIDIAAKSFMELGVKSGDVVTLSLPNIPENVISFYALNKIGAIANFIDLRLLGDKLVNAINVPKSKFILTTDIFINNLDEVINKTNINKVVVLSPADSLPPVLQALYKIKNKVSVMKNANPINWKNFVSIGKNSSLDVNYKSEQDDSICILHTSGTTGVPKAVVLSNRNFLEMALQVKYSGLKYNDNDIFLSQVPPFLAYNILSATNNPLSMGLQITMLPDYQPSKFAENILKYKPQHVIAGPADWSNFLENSKIHNKDYSFLVSMISGSDKIEESKKSEINDLMHSMGCEENILEGYGMTEMGAAAVLNVPQHNIKDSVGIPLPRVNLCICDELNNELQYNEIGEICMSGPTAMKEYYNNEEETNKIKRIHADGKYWLHTGDLGYIDKNGNVFLKGRMKRIIVRYDGFKISPYDIEKIIMNCEYVENCCVVGISNMEKGYGAVPVVNFVVKKGIDKDYVIELLKEKCKQELGEKYQPKYFRCVESLALTDVGKIDYRAIESENEEEFNKIYKKVK